MHCWGDESVDWAGISDAARYIAMFLRRWGRVGVRDYKEKWGTVRVYTSLGWHQFHDITHPGYCSSQYPDWLWKLDCYVGYRIVCRLNWAVLPLHCRLYRRAYRNAIKRWPHLRAEILHSADFAELLRGL